MNLGYFNLATINQQDVFLSVALVVSFFIFHIAFSKIFKKELKNISWIPALALSMGTTYGLWRSDFDTSVLTSNLGFSSEIVFLIAGLLILGGLFYFLKKTKIKKKSNILSFIVGGILLFLVKTGRIYQRESGIVIGVILIIIGLHPLLKKLVNLKKK